MKEINMNNHLADFQILSVATQKLNIRNSFVEYSEKMPAEKKYDLALKNVRVKKNEVTGKWEGTLDLCVKLSCESTNGSFSIDVITRGSFAAPDSMPKELFRKMMKVNGGSSLYSIVRGLVNSVSAQVFSLGNIVLPMVNFVRFHGDD